MRKFVVIALTALMVLGAMSCTSTSSTENTSVATEVAQDLSVSRFAGEYYVIADNEDGEEFVMEEFIVDEDGTIHGATEGSGFTGFEGRVNEDGTFAFEYPRFGGSGEGSFDGKGNVVGTSVVRGRMNSKLSQADTARAHS